MENVDLLNPSGASGWAFHAGARHHLDPKSVRLLLDVIHTSLNSPLLERARRAARSGAGICRELPYVRPVEPSGTGIQEGKIDLLFEEDGAWILVDYKTDEIPRGTADPGAFFRDRYRLQMSEYRAALRDLGIAVKEAYILLARTGDSVEM
jgi:ATP-dependent helicase/nuclease subunit A